jgi:hypothetical protein
MCVIPKSVIQGVPLPTKPAISLIILKPMKILQQINVMLVAFLQDLSYNKFIVYSRSSWAEPHLSHCTRMLLPNMSVWMSDVACNLFWV